MPRIEFELLFTVQLMLTMYGVNGDLYKAVCPTSEKHLPPVMLNKSNVQSAEECAVVCHFHGGLAFSLSESRMCLIYTDYFYQFGNKAECTETTIKFYNRELFEECPDGWHQHAAQCFHNSSIKTTQEQAQQHCLELGGHLATIMDKSTNMFLIGIMNPLLKYWLGGTDNEEHGTWIWESNKEPVSFNGWGKNKPSNFLDNQHCLIFMYFNDENAMKWNDKPCSNKYNILCQINMT